MAKSNGDIEQKAIEIVRSERTHLQDAVAFVTDRVAFQMRNLIRILRKNYWGIFDDPTDKITGRDKTWVPLTRTLVEGVVKNIDIDTKDINFRAKNPKGTSSTVLVRALVHDWLNKNFFGETLDEMERALAIDGTVVWKTLKGTSKDGKPEVIRKNVDLLNVYIDPTEDNIQSAYRFTERSIMTPEEIAQMDGWINTEDLIGSNIISRIDGQYQSITTGVTAKYRDVWEMWGKIPKYLISGKKEDTEEIDGRIVISGLEVNSPKVHLIEKNESGLKPYEEVRYAKVSNRWYGLGISERVMMLQIWLNTIVNIRINRSFVSQLGLFKIRKGSGITPQMLSRLGANGAITVNDVNDIEQMVMTEASQASYTDEQRIIDWAQRDTGAPDVSVGEPTPASKPATTAVLENNNAQSGFGMVKEQIGMFLQRWIDRHVLPILSKTAKKGDVLRIIADNDIGNDLVDRIVAHEANEKMEELKGIGIIPTEESLQKFIDASKQNLLKKKDVFMELMEDLVSEHVDTEVFVTNEEMDVSVVVQNLMQMMSVAPEFRSELVKEAMDLMGLQIPKAQQPQGVPPQGLPQGGQPQGIPSSIQGISTSANTLLGNLAPRA